MFAPSFDGFILMAALCVPGNSELVPAAFVGLDSLLASSTSIIQAFPTSYLYKVSPSISSFNRWTGKQTDSGLFTPECGLPRRAGEVVGMALPCSVGCLAGTREGKSGDSMSREREREGNAWTSDWRYGIELTYLAKQSQ